MIEAVASTELNDSEDRPMHGKRRILLVVLTIVLFILLDIALTFALEPYGAYAEVVWSEYYSHADDDIDTVLVGSSYAQFGFDPVILADELDCETFSLATPAQSLENSLAAIEKADRDHDIDRVVLAVAYETFPSKPWANAAVTFTQNKCLGESLPEAAEDVARLFFNEHFFSTSYSLVSLFPWTLLHVDYTPSAIIGNIRNRLTIDRPIDASKIYAPLIIFDDRGRGSEYAHLGYNEIDYTSGETSKIEFDNVNLAMLDRICAYCSEHNIDLYVVVTPKPEFEVYSFGDAYPDNMATIRDMVRGYGHQFLDYNMARAEYYEFSEYDAFDNEHLNIPGAKIFSRSLASSIRSIESGGSIEGGFYSYDEWGDYLASVDRIQTVIFDAEVVEGGIEVDARAYTGTLVDVEYEFLLTYNSIWEYEVIQPYSRETHCFIPLEGHGSCRVRVNVREVGSDYPFKRYHQLMMTY